MSEGGRLPGASRMSDYLLGSGHSLAADRRLANELERAVPDIRQVVQLGRLFLRSAVMYMVRAEIRQFLKYGSDIPTVGNAHTIAQAAEPDCRVVYVDTDPIAVAHSRMLLADNDRTAAVHAELCDLEAVAAHPEASRLLDLTAPVGLLLVDVLRFLPESWDPPSLLAGCAQLVAPGSHLAIAHLTGSHRPAEAAALTEVMSASHDPIRPRTQADITNLFTGFELLGPGVADISQWYGERPLTASEQVAATQFYVGIGRKPLLRKKK